MNRSCRICLDPQSHGVLAFPIDGPGSPGLICGPCLTALFDYIGVPDKVRAAILDAWLSTLVQMGHGDLFDAPSNADDLSTVQAQGPDGAGVPDERDRAAETVGVPGLRDPDTPDLRGIDVADREGA